MRLAASVIDQVSTAVLAESPATSTARGSNWRHATRTRAITTKAPPARSRGLKREQPALQAMCQQPVRQGPDVPVLLDQADRCADAYERYLNDQVINAPQRWICPFTMRGSASRCIAPPPCSPAKCAPEQALKRESPSRRPRARSGPRFALLMASPSFRGDAMSMGALAEPRRKICSNA